MHPGGADNIIKEGALRGRGDLGNIIGNPLETTYFLTRLIFDGTFDKFPGFVSAARTPAATCRHISAGPKPRASSATTPTAPTSASRARS